MSFPISKRIAGEINKLDVWSVFSPLSGHVPADSLNLGQGFMNWGPFHKAIEAANQALEQVAPNHYSLPKGRIALRQQLSEQYSASFHLAGNRKLDPESEIIITAGANEGIFSVFAAFLNEGDEVICVEPFFDQYTSNITFNGGKPVFVAMRPPKDVQTRTVSAAEWKLEREDLEKVVTPKTKILILNTPHNPIGKVFDEQELLEIADFAKKHNLIVLSDEVYDCLAYAPAKHVRIASLPGMWERTITCGSAGKSFSATGWRIGWLMGASDLIKPALAATTRIVFSVNSPLQEAVAGAFAQQGTFFQDQLTAYEERRQVLCKELDKLGLPYTVPDGSYFILVSIEKLQIPNSFEPLDLIKHRTRDWHAAWFIAKEAGVVVIPPTDFYSEEDAHIGAAFVRLAFCKDIDTLKKAGERLLKLKPFIKQ